MKPATPTSAPLSFCPLNFSALATLSVLFALVATPTASASGTRVGFKDAFAMARGNAFVATANNASAVYYNPAGLTQLEGTQLVGNIYTVAVSSDYRGAGGTASLDDRSHTIPAFFASWKAHDSRWAMGLGVYAPFGLSTEWPANSPLRTLAIKNEQTYRTVNLSGAYQVSPTLSVGGGLTYNKVTSDLSRAIGVFSPNDLFHFKGDGHDLGFTLGTQWKPAPEHSFGLNYQSHTSIKMNGTTDTIPLIAGEPSEATFVFPEVVMVGYSYRPTPQWNFEINLDWTNWNRVNTTTIAKASGATPLTFNWQSGLFYEIGATRYFDNGLHLSAGYLYTENSTPDNTYTPALPDSDKSFYSLGLGYTAGSISFDLAWHYGDGGTRTVKGSPASLIGATADGIYENSVNAFSISAGWRF